MFWLGKIPGGMYDIGVHAEFCLYIKQTESTRHPPGCLVGIYILGECKCFFDVRSVSKTVHIELVKGEGLREEALQNRSPVRQNSATVLMA